jgi:hypothetical protein
MKLTSMIGSGLLFALVSCSEEKQSADSPPAAESTQLSAILLNSAPQDARDISEIRQSAQPGETVTFSGGLLGDETIFSENLALMRVGDPKKLKPCPPEEGCETPWDACCDDYDLKKASIITVQVVDEDGKPFKATLKGLGGMKELGSVTVTGTVAEGSNADNMVVNATGIYVEPRSS